MFSELVTADAVLAEVSSPNANVFYELGVRHGTASRGTFMVHGGWSNFRPFDLAPDRTFSYNGQIFLTGHEPDEPALQAEVVQLATTLRNALERDRMTIGSPVFDNGVSDAFIHRMPPPDCDGRSKESLHQVFGRWQARVRQQYYAL